MSAHARSAGDGGALLTDLYQLAMLEAYHARGMTGTAVFELFVRRLPPERGFLVAAGLEPALDFLEGLRFDDAGLEWLAASGRFGAGFVDGLAGLRFTGDVHAMPEGTPFFADEPILRVTAPLPQAQIVETRLLNLIHLHTVLASKAARMVLAAAGRPLVDFGFRRAHGAEAGLAAARASYLCGFAGTATVEAGRRFGIPLFGTMAHSYVQCHGDERAAFVDFARARPHGVVLLVDTWDTRTGARRAVDAARELAREGIEVAAVRIDSGDLGEEARAVRAILDEGGFPGIRILASGSLDEHVIAELVAAGAPIDSMGVGTSLDASSDAPALDAVYKIQEYAGEARRKRSTGKATWPGRKQVWRASGAGGVMAHDVIAAEDEPGAGGESLLEPVMEAGRRIAPSPPLDAVRERAAGWLARLPEGLRRLDPAAAYDVRVAPGLRALAEAVDRRT